MNQFKKEIALKVLHRNYPVSRLKVNKRFRRAIKCDNGVVYPLDKEHKLIIKKNLLMSLHTILNFDPIILAPIIDGYIDGSL